MATSAILSLKPPASFFSGGDQRDGGNRTIVARVSRGERFHENIVRLSASTVLFLGLSSLRVCSPASARLLPPPIVVTENEINTETVSENHEVEDEKLEEDFEAYKSKVCSLTVPLKLVALRGSVPPSWIKIYLRRNYAGEKAPDGETWAVPYRWGTMIIAYKKSKFQNYKLAPIEDWADLWRPELAGRIAMVNSPREVIGSAVLKYMGASYNTTDLDSQVTGGRIAVENNISSVTHETGFYHLSIP